MLCVSQGIPLWDMPTMEGDVLYLCLEDTFCRIQDRLFRLTDEASGRLHFAVASCKLSGDMPTMEGDVLYLCLEDTFCRIQDRLFRLTDEASGRLHFAVASCKLSDGLIVQLEDYLKDYPDSRLIVIDTLQKVRTASKDNAYASDYGDISLIKDFADRHSLAVIVVHHIRKQNDSDLQKVRTASKDNAYASDYGDISLIKDFADRHSLAVIVVHHIRKQNDSDVFNKVSGTTGLTGSADATFVLEKEKRASDTAKLYVTGRDTPYQEYTLRFRDCRWELVERKTQEQLENAGAACERNDTRCPFSVGGFYGGNGNHTHGDYEMAE